MICRLQLYSKDLSFSRTLSQYWTGTDVPTVPERSLTELGYL
jgi:hypothetical protein